MQKVKRRLSLIIALVLALSLCACGSAEKSGKTQVTENNNAIIVEKTTVNEQGAANKAPDNSAPVWVRVESQEEAYPFPEDTVIKSLARINSTLLLLAEGEETAHLGLADYTVLEDGRPTISEVKELSLAPMPFEGEPILYAVTAGGDGNFYLLAGNNVNDASTALVIQQYSSTGEYLASMEIPEWDLVTVSAFSVGNNEELVLAVDDTICVYRWLNGMVKQSNGNYLVYSSSMSGSGLIVSALSMEDHRGHYFLVNNQTGNLEDLPLSDVDPSGDMSTVTFRLSGSVAPCQSLGDEYLINQGNSICLLDFEKDKVEPLIEWNPDTLNSAAIGASCRLGENSFACLLDGKLIFAWSHMVEKRESGIVRVGVLDGAASQSLTKSVSRMNSSDCPYIYETTSYNCFEEESLNKFRAELVSGAYDLIIFHNEINTSTSFFDDLYPYIDADEVLSRESFLPNLLDSLSIHGELHQIWNGASIATMIAQEDIVGDGRGLTVVDCERLVSTHDDIQSILDNKFSDEAALKQDTLQNIAYLAMTAYLDKENATCNFDSEEFANLLSLCGRIKANPDSTGTDFLLYSAWISSANDLAGYEQYYGPCSFVGYPDGKDGIHYYQLPNDFENNMATAIPANSQNKQGAWYFIKTMLSRSNQLKIANTYGSGMPVIYDITKEVAERTANENETTEFYDLIARTRYAEVYGDATLRSIIIDNSQAYLAGTRSLDETVKLIQSKASVYVSEQFG